MSAKVKKERRERRYDDSQQIFHKVRARIAEALQRPGLKVRSASSLEMAIGTFAPSELILDFAMSDYPFIGSRYVSIADGSVYIVAGSTEGGHQIMAYRLGFLQSCLSHRGGIAVGISEDGWMEANMIMFSLHYVDFQEANGQIGDFDPDLTRRTTYPQKKAKAYWYFMKSHSPVCAKLHIAFLHTGDLVAGARSIYRNMHYRVMRAVSRRHPR